MSVASGCASSKAPPTGNRSFAFSYQGADYHILSISMPTARGVNFLIQRENGRVLLRARDHDQDGTLDEVLTGNVTLEDAKTIYAVGIAEAKARGKYRMRLPSEVYVVTQPGKVFAVQTVTGVGRNYNLFTVYYPATQVEIVFLDQKANGILDHIERGEGNLEENQAIYRMVLEEGVAEGRIVRVGKAFVVRAPAGGRSA